MKLIISDEMPAYLRSALTKRGFTLLPLPSCPDLDGPVSCHPDMLLFKHSDTVVTTKEYYGIARELFDAIKNEVKISLTEEKHEKKYPGDILLNALYHGGKLYGYKKFLSRKLLQKFAENVVDVKQGYAHCSCCKVGDGVITSDPSLSLALRNNGVDVLTVTPGHITLPGYDCGFIGGASFEDESNVYFFGNLALHPDCKSITEFCKNHGKNAVSLSSEPLYDCGSAVIIE